MPPTPTRPAFTLPQLASFLAWSVSSDALHGLTAVVRCDYELFEEVIELHRDGEDRACPRWLLHRALDGAIQVVRNDADRRLMTAASPEEAQVLVEMAEAAERRAGAKPLG